MEDFQKDGLDLVAEKMDYLYLRLVNNHGFSDSGATKFVTSYFQGAGRNE